MANRALSAGSSGQQSAPSAFQLIGGSSSGRAAAAARAAAERQHRQQQLANVPRAIDVLGIVNHNQQQAGMVDSQGDDGLAGELLMYAVVHDNMFNTSQHWHLNVALLTPAAILAFHTYSIPTGRHHLWHQAGSSSSALCTASSQQSSSSSTWQQCSSSSQQQRPAATTWCWGWWQQRQQQQVR